MQQIEAQQRLAAVDGEWRAVLTDAFAELRIVDYGDAPVLPADPVHSHEAIASRVALSHGRIRR